MAQHDEQNPEVVMFDNDDELVDVNEEHDETEEYEEEYEEEVEAPEAQDKKKPFWKTPLGIGLVAGTALGVGMFAYVYTLNMMPAGGAQVAGASSQMARPPAPVAAHAPIQQSNVVQKGLVKADQQALEQLKKRMAQQKQQQAPAPQQPSGAPALSAEQPAAKQSTKQQSAKQSTSSSDSLLLAGNPLSDDVTQAPPEVKVPVSPHDKEHAKEDVTPAPMLIGMTKKAFDDVSDEIMAAREVILATLEDIRKTEDEQKQMLAAIHKDVRAVRQMTRAIAHKTVPASSSSSVKPKAKDKSLSAKKDTSKPSALWRVKAIDKGVAILQNVKNGHIKVVVEGERVQGLGAIKRVIPEKALVVGENGFVTGKPVFFE